VSEWHTETLGQLADAAGGVIRTGPFGSQLHRAEYVDDGEVAVVMPKDMIDGRIVSDSIARIDRDTATRLAEHLLQPADIVLARRGDVGRAAWVDARDGAVLCGTGSMRIHLPDGKVMPRYLHYFLQAGDAAEWLQGQAVGATMPNLNADIVRGLPVRYPSPQTQRSIIEILDSVDELIENNGRRIVLLEQMAQAIYREWFVHFRYPGHEADELVDSPLGGAPTNWEVVPVAALVQRLPGGVRYTSSEVREIGSVPVIDQSRESVLGFHDDEPGIQASIDQPVLVFGDHTCRMAVMTTPFSVGPNVIPFRPSDSFPALTLFRLIESLVETREYKRHWNDLMRRVTTRPSDACALQYSDLSKPIHQAQRALESTNRVLVWTREMLLPRLISGELDVSRLHIAARLEDSAA
jgi:type I restriction enzyme S subunit